MTSDMTPAEKAELDELRDREHDDYITTLRRDLLTELDALVQSIPKASKILAELRSDAVYDIEFAEGPEGADIVDNLADAGRALRAARTLAQRAAR